MKYVHVALASDYNVEDVEVSWCSHVPVSLAPLKRLYHLPPMPRNVLEDCADAGPQVTSIPCSCHSVCRIMA